MRGVAEDEGTAHWTTCTSSSLGFTAENTFRVIRYSETLTTERVQMAGNDVLSRGGVQDPSTPPQMDTNATENYSDGGRTSAVR